MTKSTLQRLADIPADRRESALLGLGEPELTALLYQWEHRARETQRTPPGDWRVWLILAGRGFGKTRTGAEFVRERVEAGTAQHIALVGATASDVRDTMIEGESGLLSIFPPWNRPKYEPSKRRVTFRNGAVATAFTADEPDRLRGPNHDLAWADELAAWRYPDAWDMLMLGLRIGVDPRVVVTTTPRPIESIKALVARPDCHVTRGSTYDNAANLSGAFLREILELYEGTTIGRQELHAEILDDVEGALWTRDLLDLHRVTDYPELTRIVVAIDPASTSGARSAETGIVAAGIRNNDAFILDDCSIRGTPVEWARAAIALFHRTKADRIVAEANQGGEMITHTLRTVDPTVPVRLVHASRGKQTRAEPVAALYEQGRVHHVGYFATLEDQLCSWVPGGPSPDRLDALVWALTELVVQNRQAPAVVPFSAERASPWIID